MNNLQDTFECGGCIVVGGRRYIIAEHSCYQEGGGISLNIRAMAYEHCEPMVQLFMSQSSKHKKKIKSKRKVKSL